jgi:hypothetical protein
VVLSLTAHLAFAADASVEKANQDALARFKAADTNGDGGLSRDELANTNKLHFLIIKTNFDQMDANKDGKVTPEERDAWIEAQRAKKK